MQGALERALCHGRLTNEDAFVAHVRSCRGPAPGELVGSYRDPKEEVLRVAGLPVVAKEAGPPEYQVRHAATAKDPVALEHHSRFQQLSLFFIESARASTFSAPARRSSPRPLCTQRRLRLTSPTRAGAC